MLQLGVDFVVRPASWEDYEQICSVFSQLDAHHRAALPEIFKVPSGRCRSEDLLAQALTDGCTDLLVADMGGEILGAIYLQMRESIPHPALVPRRYGWVEEVAVLEQNRGMGVGHALLLAAEYWARSMGLKEIELDVWEFNRTAIDFYEELGFETKSRRMKKRLEDNGRRFIEYEG